MTEHPTSEWDDLGFSFAQRHRDTIILMKLAEVAHPTSFDKVQLAALMMRYQGQELVQDIELVIQSWKLTPKELFLQSREIWANGFKLEDLREDGSGWDAKSGE